MSDMTINNEYKSDNWTYYVQGIYVTDKQCYTGCVALDDPDYKKAKEILESLEDQTKLTESYERILRLVRDTISEWPQWRKDIMADKPEATKNIILKSLYNFVEEENKDWVYMSLKDYTLRTTPNGEYWEIQDNFTYEWKLLGDNELINVRTAYIAGSKQSPKNPNRT